MSVDELPVSETSAMVTTGAFVSSVKLSIAVSPQMFWLAVSVWKPSARPAGVKLQAPVLSAIVVPSVALPSLITITEYGSADPWIAGFDVILSVNEVPVSATREMLSIGTAISGLLL